LKRLQDCTELFGATDILWWMDNDEETNDLLKWAYAEADICFEPTRAL
jgi:hypothetical protein